MRKIFLKKSKTLIEKTETCLKLYKIILIKLDSLTPGEIPKEEAERYKKLFARKINEVINVITTIKEDIQIVKKDTEISNIAPSIKKINKIDEIYTKEIKKLENINYLLL